MSNSEGEALEMVMWVVKESMKKGSVIKKLGWLVRLLAVTGVQNQLKKHCSYNR